MSAEEQMAQLVEPCSAWRDEGIPPERAYERLTQAERLPKLYAGKLLRQVYGLNFEEMSAVIGAGSPFRTPADTVRYLREELGFCSCVGEQPILFLRDVLKGLDERIKAAGQPAPDEFQAKTAEFIQQAGLTGENLDGIGPWFVLLLGQKDLLFHNRNIGDCFLTRKGEYFLKALNVLITSDELPQLFQNTVKDPEGGEPDE